MNEDEEDGGSNQPCYVYDTLLEDNMKAAYNSVEIPVGLFAPRESVHMSLL